MEDSISFIGFGSLLSEKSARITCPNLSNFRLAKVKGYRRIFNFVHPLLIAENSLQDVQMKLSGLNAYPCEQTELVVSVFDIPNAEWPQLKSREVGYNIKLTTYEELSSHHKGQAYICEGYPCDNTMAKDHPEFINSVREYYTESIIRPDLLPMPLYLKHCLDAARNHNEDVYNNFLDTSYLGDGITTIRKYLEQTPEALQNVLKQKFKTYTCEE